MLIRVEDATHKVIGEYGGTFAYDFLGLCRRMADRSVVMRIVNPYDDAMLNRIQQGMLREELSDLLTRSMLEPAEVPAAYLMLAAVEGALLVGGYVRILGE